MEMGENGFYRQLALNLPGWGGNPNPNLSIQQRRALSIRAAQEAASQGTGVFNHGTNIPRAGVFDFGSHNTMGVRPNQAWACGIEEVAE